jgi:hypothetical protein
LSELDVRRLRRGELAAGTGGVLLFVFMFVPDWYALNSTFSQTAGNLRWHYLALLTILLAIALAYFQAAERAPAIPVTLAAIVTVLGIVTVLALIYRILAGPPNGGSYLSTEVGPYLGLAAAIAIAYGGWASLREEAGADLEEVGIETIGVGMRSHPPGS